jgi:hypothetical protein
MGVKVEAAATVSVAEAGTGPGFEAGVNSPQAKADKINPVRKRAGRRILVSKGVLT